MIRVSVLDKNGKEVGGVDVDEAVLGGSVNRAVLRQAVHMYECNRRHGTASTKTRAEIRGSSRKLFPQKHTGRARAGDRKAPHMRGGGIAFGPKPRDYSKSLPKKMRRLALRSAYLSKLLDQELVVINELKFDAPATKEMAAILRALDVDRGCLIGTKDTDSAVWKSGRNIPRVEVKPVQDINAYDLLLRKHLVLTQEALEAVLERFTQTASKAQEATA